jgi:3-oxoacyl-[acyl-carrier protein] reductase
MQIQLVGDAGTMTENTKRVAVVTGGSRGIGRQISLDLSDRGYAIAVVYAGNTAAADETVTTIVNRGGVGRAFAADIADEVAVSAVFDAIETEWGGVDVLVNAAGVMPLGRLVDLDLTEVDRALRVNVRGTLVVDQQAARRMRAGGSIINLTSSVTRFGSPGNIAYIASKAAVEGITIVLARELRGRDITVNAVAPGPVITDMLSEFLSADSSGVEKTRIAGQSPLDRLGTTEDISEIVVFLATGARWINGQVLFANGGAI